MCVHTGPGSIMPIPCYISVPFRGVDARRWWNTTSVSMHRKSINSLEMLCWPLTPYQLLCKWCLTLTISTQVTTVHWPAHQKCRKAHFASRTKFGLQSFCRRSCGHCRLTVRPPTPPPLAPQPSASTAYAPPPAVLGLPGQSEGSSAVRSATSPLLHHPRKLWTKTPPWNSWSFSFVISGTGRSLCVKRVMTCSTVLRSTAVRKLPSSAKRSKPYLRESSSSRVKIGGS